MSETPTLPEFMRRIMEQECHAAEHPQGMSVHDGKAQIPSTHIRRALLVMDRQADRIEQLERELSEARKDAADLCRRAAQECEATYKTCTDIYEKAIALGAKRQAEKLAAALDTAHSQKEG